MNTTNILKTTQTIKNVTGQEVYCPGGSEMHTTVISGIIFQLLTT